MPYSAMENMTPEDHAKKHLICQKSLICPVQLLGEAHGLI